MGEWKIPVLYQEHCGGAVARQIAKDNPLAAEREKQRHHLKEDPD